MSDANPGINRAAAYDLLVEKLGAHDRLVKHCLAAEAIMRALSPRFGADVAIRPSEVFGFFTRSRRK